MLKSEDVSSGTNHEIVQGLITMFDQENEIVKAFRMARDHFK